MVLHITDHLDVPSRKRAPPIDCILKAHEPYPALAIDRHWRMISANAAVTPLLGGVDPELLRPSFNVLRLSLHPCRDTGPPLDDTEICRAVAIREINMDLTD